MKDKIKKITSHYDFSNQVMQLSEECAELIQAVNKYRRFRGSKNTRDEIIASTNDSNMLIQNIAEEIADVEIMLEQMKVLLNLNPGAIEQIKEKKVNRQLARIERERGK
jgi:NTP pyrophosphatase (non-canonical NTP hydrolase)